MFGAGAKRRYAKRLVIPHVSVIPHISVIPQLSVIFIVHVLPNVHVYVIPHVSVISDRRMCRLCVDHRLTLDTITIFVYHAR